MTTTAATTSASPASTSSTDSPPIQDLDNGASEQATAINAIVNRSPTPPTQTTTAPSATPPATATIAPNSSTIEHQQSSTAKQTTQSSNNTEQKRPMNAFLLFCKRQRSLVREKYPNLENRGITKILGDWWSKLDKEQKSKYTDLARQHKEAFMKANPDFKWCKTPMSSNNNNNNNNNSSSAINNTNSSDCYATNNRNHKTTNTITSSPSESSSSSSTILPSPVTILNNHHHLHSHQPNNHLDIIQSNSRDALINNRPQNEAPKPPKKRFLERNDSVYTTNNKNNSAATINEPTHAKDGVVPYISLDQDTLDRVIEQEFSKVSKESNISPSGIDMCKCSNRISTNNFIPSSIGGGINQNNSFSTSTTSSSTVTATANATTTATTTANSSSSYSTSIDEPVDFSMNRTINATRQQIINNLVDKLLSGPTDNNASSATSKLNGTDSVQSHPPVRRDSPEEM